MHRIAVINTAAVQLLLIFAAVNAASFGASVLSTRCNTDPNQGEVNNPCGSLYDAVCGGEYCRCPVGAGVHPNLRRCVRGYDGGDDVNGNDGKNNQGSQSDLFGDLPFDYVPPGSKDANAPRQTDIDNDVSDIRCGGSLDTCAARHGAVCVQGRCRCPAGTIDNPIVARCDPDPAYHRTRDHDNGDHDNGDHDNGDHDNGDHDHDDDDSSWFGGNSGTRAAGNFEILAIAAVGIVAGRLM